VLDNIAPLRQITPARLASAGWMVTPPTAIRSGPDVTLSWYLRSKPTHEKLELLDSTGAVLRTWEPDTARPARRDSAQQQGGGGGGRGGGGGPTLPMNAGFNRISWDLRTEPYKTFPGMIFWGARASGPAAPPGPYTVRLTADGQTYSAPLRVERNPWITDVTDADMHAQYEFSRAVRDKVNEANTAVIDIRNVKSQLDDRLKRSSDGRLRSAGTRLRTNASAVEEDIYQVRNQSNQDPLNFPIRVNNRLANLMSMAERGDGRPTNNMPEIFGILTDQLKGYTDRLDAVWAKDLADVNARLARLGLPPIDPKCGRPEGCGAVM
jgi:hypothetical protein